MCWKIYLCKCGIIVNVTPFEPEWEGYVTLEISNTTPLPQKSIQMKVYVRFSSLSQTKTCDTSYKDKSGKYLKQVGIHCQKLINENNYSQRCWILLWSERCC